MPSSNPAKSFRRGDRVIFSLPRHGANPGVGAKDIRPERRGEGYRYIVQDFWVVADTHGARVAVQTRQGRIHILDATDARMRLASWWQRLIYHRRFPKPHSGTPQRSLPARIPATKPREKTGSPMYKTNLVTLDTTPTDRATIEHVKTLAKLMGSRVVLLHVADGWAARTFGEDVVGPEITEDKAYLEQVRKEFESAGIPVDAFLAYGNPVTEIIRWVHEKHCDLVAMSTHGHRFLADLLLGVTASRVQHHIDVPVLWLRAKSA